MCIQYVYTQNKMVILKTNYFSEVNMFIFIIQLLW
jgi:hypothetical protein